MSRFPKPCLDCGVLTKGGNRCEEHENLVKSIHNAKRNLVKKATGQYSGSYRARANDTWVADHVNPGDNGDTALLLPAHKSCNEKRGNKPLE